MPSSVFIHDLDDVPAHWTGEWADPVPEFDAALLRRIADAFERSLARDAPVATDMWTIIGQFHQPFVDLLLSRRYLETDSYFARMFSSPLGHGIQQGHVRAEEFRTSERHRNEFLANIFDKLLALAEAVRAIPVQNPEQGDFSSFLRADPDEIFDRIEAKAGIRIVLPHFQGGLFGLKTKRGIVSVRDLYALHVAIRIRDLTADRGARLCEIGGGAGGLAYYANMLGYRDYTIIDLPVQGAVQAYFLARNLGSDRIVLSGEPRSQHGIKLLHPSEFPDGRYDLVINVDSFPEIASPIVEGYLRRIRDCAPRLLSINQEALNARTHVNRRAIGTPFSG